MPLTGWLLDPLSDPALARGLLAALVIGGVIPVLGTYVVLRGMAFLGDALAHIILPGIVIASLLGWPLILGALIVGVAAALAIGAIGRRTILREDTAIGVVFAAAFALGVALFSMQPDYSADLEHVLFGDLLQLSAANVTVICAVAALVVLVVVGLYKEFLVLSFDRLLASTMRLPVELLNNLMLVLLALVIVISYSAVGVVLVLAMLVTPTSAAYLVTRRLPTMMVLASTMGVVSGVVGFYLAYYLGIASGAAIVLVATALFGVVFALVPARGGAAHLPAFRNHS